MESDIFAALADLKGRARAVYDRDLTLDDLAGPKPAAQPPVPTLRRLKASHHAVARCLAEGRKGAEIFAMTGYSHNRLATLQNDPAFQELIEYYRSQQGEIYADVHRKLAILGSAAVDQLLEDLEETPDKFSVKDKLEVANMALERSGIAPIKSAAQVPGASRGVTVNIQFQKPEDMAGVPTIDLVPDKEPEGA